MARKRDRLPIFANDRKQWSGIKNGELLRRARGVCDVFRALDRNLELQQNIKVLSFGVVIVRSRPNRIKDLSPQIPDILHAAIEFRPGQVMTVGAQVFGGSRPVPIGGHSEMTCGYQSFATYGKFMTMLFDTAVKLPGMKIFPRCAICYCLFGVVSLPVYSAEQAIKLIVTEGCGKQWEDQGRLATTFPFSMM